MSHFQNQPCGFIGSNSLIFLLIVAAVTSTRLGDRTVFNNVPLPEQLHTISNSKHISNNVTFPSLSIVLEMASLSSLIYAFHTENYGNNDINNHVCDRINNGTINDHHNDVLRSTTIRNNIPTTYNRTIPMGIHCEWYHHDWITGTQIMIVSSTIHNYITIVFAGTDDLTTSLTDLDVLLSNFGYPVDIIYNHTTNSSSSSNNNNSSRSPYPYYNVSLSDPNIRVHAGFDTSIYNEQNIFGEIIVRMEQIRYRLLLLQQQQQQEITNTSTTVPSLPLKIYTTGHSLGASHSILTAVGMVQYYEQVRNGTIRPPIHQYISQQQQSNNDLDDPQTDLLPIDHIYSINFGCPQLGNVAWRDYIHSNDIIQQRLSIYRFVLGWDLVPRLPSLLQHVGHTIQLSTISSSSTYFNYNNITTNLTVLAYYHHLGDIILQYASVPFGWSATPFIWIPGAIFSHYITAYIQFFTDYSNYRIYDHDNTSTTTLPWIHDFEKVVSPDNTSNNTNFDDDYYVEPPENQK